MRLCGDSSSKSAAASELRLPNRQRHSVLSSYPMSDRESYRFMAVEFVGSMFFAFVACGAVVSSGIYVHEVQFSAVLPVRALVNALAQGLALAAVFATFAFLDHTTVHPDDRDSQRFSRLRIGDTVLFRVLEDTLTHTGTVLRIADAERGRHLVELSSAGNASRLERWYAAWSENLWGQWAYPFPLPTTYVVQDTLSHRTHEIQRSHIREPVQVGDEVEITVDGRGELATVARQVSVAEWEVELDSSGSSIVLDSWNITASPHRVYRLGQFNPLVTYALCLLGELHPHFALMLFVSQTFGCFCGIGLVACSVPDARAFQLGVMDAARSGTEGAGALSDLTASAGGTTIFASATLQAFVFVFVFLTLALDAKGKSLTPVVDNTNNKLSIPNKALLLMGVVVVVGGMLGAGVHGAGINPAYSLAAGALAGTFRHQFTVWLAGLAGAFLACGAFLALAPIRYARQVTSGCCCHSHRHQQRRAQLKQLQMANGKKKLSSFHDDIAPKTAHDADDDFTFHSGAGTEGSDAEEFGKLWLRRELLSFLIVQVCVGGIVSIVSLCRCCDCSGRKNVTDQRRTN